MKTLASSILLAAIAAALALPHHRAPAADAKVDFVRQIKPILESACINCHNSESLFGNLNLENRARAFGKRKEGTVIIPGSPEKSPLYVVLTLPQKKTKKAMPPTGHRIPKEEMDLVKHWIEQGAKWPEGADGTVKPKPGAKAPDGANS